MMMAVIEKADRQEALHFYSGTKRQQRIVQEPGRKNKQVSLERLIYKIKNGVVI
jgi:hypothetical protein